MYENMSQSEIAERLKEELGKGVVSFAYEKKDGSWRNAVGTRNENVIKLVDGTMPTGTGKEHTGVIPYWDIESAGWRCFGEDSVIEIKEAVSMDEYKTRMISQGYEI